MMGLQNNADRRKGAEPYKYGLSAQDQAQDQGTYNFSDF